MKIKEYIEETNQYKIELSKLFDDAKQGKEIDYSLMLKLFEVIENRMMDAFAWEKFGLSHEDDIPRVTDRIIIPNLNIEDENHE